MHPFSTTCKRQKTVRFSDVFRGYRKGALGTNRLSLSYKECGESDYPSHDSLYVGAITGTSFSALYPISKLMFQKK